MNNETVCAVVVTYNRKKLLIECLESLENQSRHVDAIYIMDNASTDGTPELLLEKGYITEVPPIKLETQWETLFQKNEILIHYIQMHENVGGAGGFHEGMKKAYKKGYNWIWIMDDDSEPRKDSLEILSEYFDDKNISALCPTVLNTDNSIQLHHRGYLVSNGLHYQKNVKSNDYNQKVIEIDIGSFVGILVNSDKIAKIGFPKKEFFIHHDDTEYTLRLREVGQNLLIPKSKILHKNQRAIEGSSETIFLRRKFSRKNYENLWLNYFSMRNSVWIGKKHTKNPFRLYVDILKKFIFRIGVIILFNEDHKIRRIIFLKEAYLDGLKGIFDNNKPKRILYK